MGRRKITESLNSEGIPVVCQRIRLYRNKKGLEQKELAKALGIHPNAISNWENGRNRPDLTLIPDICRILEISIPELFDIPVPEKAEPITVSDNTSEEDATLLANYHSLSVSHQLAVTHLIEDLQMAENEELYHNISEGIRFTKQLAAGFDPGCEFEDTGEITYFYSNRIHPLMDCIFPVSGDSMEPEFHNGDYVMVQRLNGNSTLIPGEIGAFIVGNETYIKQYQKSGLRSLNKKYKVMKFTEDDSVYLIGRVLGVLPSDALVTFEDSKKYERVKKIIEG